MKYVERVCVAGRIRSFNILSKFCVLFATFDFERRGFVCGAKNINRR